MRILNGSFSLLFALCFCTCVRAASCIDLSQCVQAGRIRSENRNFTVQVKRNMTENQVKPKKSKMKILIYVILGLVLLTVFLEMSGVADVAGKRETETIIDRPHQ